MLSPDSNALCLGLSMFLYSEADDSSPIRPSLVAKIFGKMQL
jgi:hypothetical protein